MPSRYRSSTRAVSSAETRQTARAPAHTTNRRTTRPFNSPPGRARNLRRRTSWNRPHDMRSQRIGKLAVAAASRPRWPAGTWDSSGFGRALCSPGGRQYSQFSGTGSSAPLFLELERALSRRRPAEVEDFAALGDRRFDHPPVEQVIGAEVVEIANRRRPGHLDQRAGSIAKRGGNRALLQPDDEQLCPARESAQDFLEQTPVHRPACPGRACSG